MTIIFKHVIAAMIVVLHLATPAASGPLEEHWIPIPIIILFFLFWH